jgi:hypothetical protein
VRLADTSAWVLLRRRGQPELRASFDDEVVEGEIAWLVPRGSV